MNGEHINSFKVWPLRFNIGEISLTGSILKDIEIHRVCGERYNINTFYIKFTLKEFKRKYSVTRYKIAL